MKKLSFILIAMAVVYQSASAQGFGYGVKAGVNVSSMSDFANSKSIAGFTGGFFAELKLIPILGVSADILYSRQGVKSDEVISGDVRIHATTVKTDYLNIPILANYYILPGLAVKAGLQPGFLLGARQDGRSIKSDFKTVDLTVPVGVSYKLPLIGLIFDARYNIGVTNVIKEGPSSRNNFFSLTVGRRL